MIIGGKEQPILVDTVSAISPVPCFWDEFDQRRTTGCLFSSLHVDSGCMYAFGLPTVFCQLRFLK